jgi:hypothetical protein
MKFKISNKKLLIGVLALTLLVGIVSAAVIAPWSKISGAKYGVYETTTTWTPLATVDLDTLYGAQEASGSEQITVTTTTYAAIKFNFAVGDDSNLAGLQNWYVDVSYWDGSAWQTFGHHTHTYSYPEISSATLSGSLTYYFKFDYWVKAENYQFGGAFEGGTIIVYCQTETPS